MLSPNANTDTNNPARPPLTSSQPGASTLKAPGTSQAKPSTHARTHAGNVSSLPPSPSSQTCAWRPRHRRLGAHTHRVWLVARQTDGQTSEDGGQRPTVGGWPAAGGIAFALVCLSVWRQGGRMPKRGGDWDWDLFRCGYVLDWVGDVVLPAVHTFSFESGWVDGW